MNDRNESRGGRDGRAGRNNLPGGRENAGFEDRGGGEGKLKFQN